MQGSPEDKSAHHIVTDVPDDVAGQFAAQNGFFTILGDEVLHRLYPQLEIANGSPNLGLRTLMTTSWDGPSSANGVRGEAASETFLNIVGFSHPTLALQLSKQLTQVSGGWRTAFCSTTSRSQRFCTVLTCPKKTVDGFGRIVKFVRNPAKWM